MYINKSVIAVIGGFAFLSCLLYGVGMVIRIKKNEREWDNMGNSNQDSSSHGELLSQNCFWECDDCGAEFRVLSGETPATCPFCGETFVEMPAGTESGAAPYMCLHCGPYLLLDGDDSDICPICGSKDVTPSIWLLRRQARWICSSCNQEFVVPSSPNQCPHCGEKFRGVAGEADEEISVHTCRFCGEETEMFYGEETKFCPKCGREQ